MITGCVSDSQASDPLLLSLLPRYVEGSRDDTIYYSDDYTILEYSPQDYTLYDNNHNPIDPLNEGDTVPNVDLQLTLNVEEPGKDLYFIFTNISPTGETSYPEFYTPEASIQQSSVSSSTTSKQNPFLTDTAGTRGKPEVTEFNRNPYAALNRINPVNMLLSLVPASEPVADVADSSTGNFYIDKYTSVAATCRYTGSATVSPPESTSATKTLNIWVANNCWVDGGTKARRVNQDMVDAMAAKFLQTDLDNDIYDWVTAIYGEEWGEPGPYLSESDSNQLIDPNNEITILLFDIDNDNSTSGGVLGYFWAKDNFKKSSISYSNERIMFYMDAVLYATNESTWDIKDRWPSEIISTLAHEFQHMIQFYQKTVLRTDGSSGTETWIDEMCSLASEDLVSNKLEVNGPRGAVYSKAECTSDSVNDDAFPYISLGRLPIANYFNEFSVTAWYSGSYKLISYSLNYAFGSYLSRNFGGAQFFHDVVHNEYTDYRAITTAIGTSLGSSLSERDKFGTALRKLAASNLLSDREDMPADYEYNNGSSWFTSSVSSITYELGSINLYKYRYEYYTGRYYDGPYIYEEMRTGNMPAASNIYYLAGEKLYGEQTWNIKLKSNIRLTVIARDSLP